MTGERAWSRPVVLHAVSSRRDAPKIVVSPTLAMMRRFPRPEPPAGLKPMIDLMQRARDRETYGGACD